MMMQVYAIVEFEKKSCSIVPMTWICGNDCFWPKTYRDVKKFQQLVSEYTPPKEDWAKYRIVKIHDTLTGMENCEKRLSQILEDSSSESVIGNTSLVRREIMSTISSSANNEIMGRKFAVECHDSGTNTNVNNLINEDDVPSEIDNFSDRSLDSPVPKKAKTINKAKSIKSSVSRGRNEKLKAKKIKIACKVNNVWPDSSSTDEEKSFKGYSIPSNSRRVTDDAKPEKKNSGSVNNVLSPKSSISTASEDDDSNSPSEESLKNLKFKDGAKPIRVLQNVIVPQNISPSCSKTTFLRLNNTSFTTQNSSPIASRTPTPTASRTGTPTACRAASPTNSRNRFEATVIQHLEKLTEVQDQNTIKIDQLWKIVNESKLKHVSKPEEFPILPVNKKDDFQKLEELLLDEPMHNYLKNRLACIGGLNVRSTVMGMLKFCITNRLATKFNWAGHNKRSFKETKLKEVIYEATELCFSSGKPSDMNDKVINQAMKDWLRLAAQRKSK